MTIPLHQKKCVPCEIETPPLSETEAKLLLKKIPEWTLDDNKIFRRYIFKDFQEALEFVNKVGEIAEEESHHPDISISYNKVTLTLFTHASKGLTENDFIVASKIDGP